ncbi:hypothetical protein AAMO2058_001516900 [Amorphochlora amoebiformis]
MAPLVDVKDHDYDLAVIGGGSGGLAAAKEAASLGARVVLFDYVKPSTQGTTWGLGGTCVNVGCVPKKLMHYASLLSESLSDAKKYGWEFEGGRHNWDTMRDRVQSHVKSLNFGYKVGLRKAGVNYMNALAKLDGNGRVLYTLKSGTQGNITAKHILLAVGGRPRIPKDVPGAEEDVPGAEEDVPGAEEDVPGAEEDVPGAEEDVPGAEEDIPGAEEGPSSILIIGGSYIALETAGFLTHFGVDTHVAVRSHVLRGFDRQCAEKIKSHMEATGTQFWDSWVPIRLQKMPTGDIEATLRHSNGSIYTKVYDRVMFATGRRPDIANLGLDKVGITPTENGKLSAKPYGSLDTGLHAVGDIVEGGLELTPVAIRQGEILARRLFGASNEDELDYEKVATTVFTPMEYGCVGLSEEAARERYGEHDVEVFLSEFSTLELAAAHRSKAERARKDKYDTEIGPSCLSKLVCIKSQDMKVAGFHFVGPNAGEITQGFALAVLLGAKKRDFDRMVGIHPTDAESFAALHITKSSGESWVAAGGCGGGKCG